LQKTEWLKKFVRAGLKGKIAKQQMTLQMSPRIEKTNLAQRVCDAYRQREAICHDEAKITDVLLHCEHIKFS